jgi:hypothetical protein
MAARATFEEMSATLANILSRAASTVDVVRLEAVADVADGARSAARAPAVANAPGPHGPVGPRFTVALRVRSDLGLLYVPTGWRPVAFGDRADPIEVVLHDADREIAVVRVPPSGTTPVTLPATTSGVTGFLYVAVIQGTRSGPTIQPAFVGRADTETDARWSAPLVVFGGTAAVPVGALVYAIDGRVIGLATRHEAGVAIVPAGALDDAVARLAPAGAPQE